MLWIRNTYSWVKENMLVVGAAIGSIATILLAVLLRRKDGTAEIVLKHKQESNENRAEKDSRALEITEKFAEDVSLLRDQAKKAGENLSREREEALVQRLDAFTSASTKEEKREIADDIQEVFPFMGMVDPSEFGIIEDGD